MLTPPPAHNGHPPRSRFQRGHLVLDWTQPLDQAIETCAILEVWLDLVDPASPCWCPVEAQMRAAGGGN